MSTTNASELQELIDRACRYIGGKCNSSRCPCRPLRARLLALKARAIAPPRQVSYPEIRAWVERHNLDTAFGSIADARAAFEDAQSYEPQSEEKP